MSNFGRRNAPRKRVAIEATVAGSKDGGTAMVCLVRDASRTGCRITAQDVRDLPEKVWLRLRGFSHPIPGTIVWKRIRSAGIKFDWDNDTSAGSSKVLLDL